MSKLLQLLSGNVIKQVGNVLDNLTTSKEEKLDAERAIKEILEKADSEAQQQVIKKHKANDYCVFNSYLYSMCFF